MPAVFAVGSLATAGTAHADPTVPLGGGSGILIEDLSDATSASACTITAVGTDRDNDLVALTAGHCGEIGARVAAEENLHAGSVGVIVNKSSTGDWAVIVLNPGKVAPVRQVGPTVIDTVGGHPRVGDLACKNGRTTGFTCGPIWETHSTYFRSELCANHGDSGAPVLEGNRVVGMVVAGTDFTAGPIDIPLPDCTGPGDLIHEPELATDFAGVLADIDRGGGPGAGFHLI
ncbi:peptidase S1 [Nocardia stercoris]|uniref:Peptidase S1 n=1 Tax=Nocardia stercoris TaxID=2483361 RepID=A0A3M2L0C7_9NOCA|nr:peptidase S1 [Nocardia stercoris]